MKKIYFALAATTFKERFVNHKKDFNHKQRSNISELSKYTWSCIKWSIVEKFMAKKKLIVDLCI